MIQKPFAPEYEREGKYIKFPRDIELRKANFIPEAMQHPAKANLYLIEELVKWCSEPGQRVMDITAGTGSILLACKMGRKVTMIELNQFYAEQIKQSGTKMGLAEGKDYTMLVGDCQSFLPLQADAIIFSPPYSTTMSSTGGIMRKESKIIEQYDHYQGRSEGHKDPRNLGNVKAFMFNQIMNGIYKKCWDSLPSGGKLALIIKDFINSKSEVEPLGWRHVQMLGKAGWKQVLWEEWDAPGTQFKALHRAKGSHVTEGEHIIIAAKP